MARIDIRRTDDVNVQRLTVFQQIEKRLEEVPRRAFQLFEQRGRQTGQELEDWVRAEHELLGSTAAELVEKNGKYELELALPGCEESQVEITATPTVIAVHAEIQPEKGSEETRILWSEFGPKEIYRLFQMPQQIDVSTTSAILEQGLLKVSAAKQTVPYEMKPLAVVKAFSAIPARRLAV